jgi:hypothetical protein
MLDKLACEEAPKPENTIQCLQKLMNSPVKPESLWNVYAYVINKDIITPTGVDDLRAYVFPLGSFFDFKKAEKHVKKLIEETGYNHIVIAQYGMPIPISTNVNCDVITKVTVDTNNKLIQMEAEENKRQKKLYEEKIKYEKELRQECLDEGDIDHIEHFKRQAYLASMHYQNYKDFLNKSNQAYTAYQQCKQIIKNHDLKHPNHKHEFLPYLKDKLIKRDEEDLYNKIKQAYLQCQDDLLQ